jgi:4a-hydroxytetrahydrobiopterin dehydratase
MSPLTEHDIRHALRDLPGWEVEGDRLLFTHDFGSFRAAMAFLVRLGFEAEAMNHHPEIHNVYGRVRLALTTHDAGDRITAKDVELAGRVLGLL